MLIAVPATIAFPSPLVPVQQMVQPFLTLLISRTLLRQTTPRTWPPEEQQQTSEHRTDFYASDFS